MKYTEIEWTAEIQQIRDLENDELLLIRTRKETDLYRIFGNLETDVSFKLKRVRDGRQLNLEDLSNAMFAKI